MDTATIVTGRSVSRLRVLVSAAAILATLPYLSLKIAWLTGSRVGILDPQFGHRASMQVANALTFVLDVIAALLALAFVTGWGRRLPSWVVAAPMWVGCGLLGEVLAIVPLQVLFGATDTHSGKPSLAPWVYTLGYGGFTCQGLFLLTGFALYARARWGERWQLPMPSRPIAPGVAATVAACAMCAAGIIAIGWGQLPGNLANVIGESGLALLAGAGLFALATGRPALPRRVPLAVVWVASAALTSWGAYGLVLGLVPTDLTAGHPVRSLYTATMALRVVTGLAVIEYVRRLVAAPLPAEPQRVPQ